MPEQGIAFAGHAGEFGSGNPGGLHELELAADVGALDNASAGVIRAPYARPRRTNR